MPPHLGMVLAEPVEDLDGFRHSSLLRVQDPAQQSEPRVNGIACEQRIEPPSRFHESVFGGERDDSFKRFVEGRGLGRKNRHQHESASRPLFIGAFNRAMAFPAIRPGR